MSVSTLELGGPQADGLGTVNFADERDTPNRDADDKIASVTLAGTDSTWGEFLTEADVARLHAWTAALLADHYDRDR